MPAAYPLRLSIPVDAHGWVAERYDESDELVSDALEWFGCVVEEPSADLVDLIVRDYQASSAHETAVDDFVTGIRSLPNPKVA